MELSPFSQEASRGLRACNSWRLQFWKAQELQLQAGEDCLNRLDEIEAPPDKRTILSLARAAAPAEATPESRLAVLRRSLEALALESSASLTGLAGLALALRDLSDPALRPQVEKSLQDALPAHPALKASAPSPDWLLHQAARPEPCSGKEWSKQLQYLSVRPALNELADPELKAFLNTMDKLQMTPEGQAAAERWCLANLESGPGLRTERLLDQTDLPAADASRLGAWMLQQSTNQPVKTLISGLGDDPPYRAAARLLQAPELTLSGAARELRELPERSIVRALSALQPENPSLRLLTQVSQLPALQAGLAHVELEPVGLLAQLKAHLPPLETEALALELVSPQVREQVGQVRELSPEGRAALALTVLTTQEPAEWLCKTPLSDQDTVELGQWTLGRSRAQAVTRMAQEEPHAAVYRAAAAQLDQPFSAARAARDLVDHLPPLRVVEVLLAAEPCPALEVLSKVKDPEVVKLGLHHLDSPVTLLEHLSPLLSPSQVIALVSSDDPLLEAVRSQPWPQGANQVAVVLAGCRALEGEAPAEPSRRIARMALTMARATPDINEKLWLARAALKAMDHPAAAPLLELTNLEGPNSRWSQAAIALGALRCLSEDRSGGLRPVLETVSLASQTWAGPEWRGQLQKALEDCPGELGALARGSGGLERLSILLDDPILSAISQEKPRVAIAETPTHLVVAGVRLGKKNAGPAAAKPLAAETAAVAAPIATRPALEVGAPPEPGEKVRVESKTSYQNGIAVVFNPISGQFEERTSYKNGVAGVFHPDNGQVEWQTSYQNGVGAAFNPASGQVEWKTSYQNGIAGVYDPTAGEIKWKTSYKNGIAGLYQPASRTIRWETSYQNGAALATNEPEYPVRPLGPGF